MAGAGVLKPGRAKSLVAKHIEAARAGKIDFSSFIPEVLEKSRKIQKKYSPFITINEDIAKRTKTPIKALKASRKGQKEQMLFGLPVSFKDCICTKGMQTTAGSRILEGYVPPFDATCVSKVKEQGGLVLGKTAQDEFGFGTFSTNCAYGVPKNPLDPERSCGGSSGGAGCLVAAADFPHIAIAESTGGSITAPAAFTGTVGLTPTYGRVSRWGLIDYANSMDKIGVIGKCVYDVALGFSVISGFDPMDSTSQDPEGNGKSADFTKALDSASDVKGLKIGVPKEYFGEGTDGSGVDGKVSKLVWQRIKELESLGAKVSEVSLPMTKYAVPAYYLIAVSEASTNLSKYCGMRYGLQEDFAKPEGSENFEEYFSRTRKKGFGEEALRRIILGTFARMAGFRDAYYLKALKVRGLIVREFKQAFRDVDVLAAPSMPVFPLKFSEIGKLSPVENYMMDILTVSPNMAGIPMISVPAGSSGGLPAGLHLMADHFCEAKLFRAAQAAEGCGK